MFKKIIRIATLGSLITVLFLSCGRQPNEPNDGGAHIALSLVYGEGITTGILIQPFLNEEVSAGSSLGKGLNLQSIDLVRVVVADLSKYETIDEVWYSEEYLDYLQAAQEWEGDFTNFGEWVKLIGDHYSLIANQTLSMEGDTARGTVTGVIGLNHCGVALIEDNVIRYWGEGSVFGEEDRTVGIEIYVSEWINWDTASYSRWDRHLTDVFIQ